MASKAFVLLGTTLLILVILPHTLLASRPNPTSSKDSKPFDFLLHLDGCRKGQTVKGTNELKQYLKRFGYLNSVTSTYNDEFDELLESAVKTYQLNYNLKVTGILDSQTIKQIMVPRCGVPDIFEDGRTSMISGKNSQKQHQHHDHGLHTVSHFQFFPNSPKWPPSKTQLTYTFLTDSIPSTVDIQTLRSACSSAFSTWASVTSFSFQEVIGQADIRIGFHEFDGPSKTLAHATAPTYGLFHYDVDENWSSNPSAENFEFDLESLAVHEIGHLLGLDHSSDPNAVMVSGIASGSIKRNLADDDINGIQTLYGLSK